MRVYDKVAGKLSLPLAVSTLLPDTLMHTPLAPKSIATRATGSMRLVPEKHSRYMKIQENAAFH